MQYIHLLGRQPKLSLAELETRYEDSVIAPLLPHAALITTENPINQKELGGTIKTAFLLNKISGTNWQSIVEQCKKQLLSLAMQLPERKITFGISVYGSKITSQKVQAATLECKKVLKQQTEQSIRAVQNTRSELTSAQVLHNKLATANGIELIVLIHNGQTYFGRTMAVQDIDDYAHRDYQRPKRDAFVGMLPPKLAQIMLNLSNVAPHQRVLDPFCGTGVVLQEAVLRGCAVYGTDINDKMIRYTQENLTWLQAQYGKPIASTLATADATEAKWEPPLDAVVCETYLGQPLSGLPKPEKLARIIQNCNVITTKFLKNIHTQLTSGTRCTIAVPAWQVGRSFKHLRVIDQLEELGYNRISFKYVSNQDLLYYRADQIVARELLVLQVK